MTRNTKLTILGVIVLLILGLGVVLRLALVVSEPTDDESREITGLDGALRGISSELRPVVSVPFGSEAALNSADERSDWPTEDDAAIRGRVVDALGSPVEGAEVRLLRRSFLTVTDLFNDEANFEIQDRGRTKTNVAGDFRIVVRDLAPLTVFVEAPGFAPARSTDRRPGDEVLIRLQAAGTVSGRVIYADDQSPVIDAEVCLQMSRDRSASRVVRTNSSGSFHRDSLTPGNYFVFVNPIADPVPTTQPLSVAAGSNALEPILVLRGIPVGGRVLDAKTQLPIANATVGLTPRYIKTAQSDIDGNFAFAGIGPDEANWLRARATGFAENDRPTITKEPDRIRVTFMLNPGATITGRVVGVDSQPIAGVEVISRALLPEEKSMSVSRSITRADGKFQVLGIPIGARCEYKFVKAGLAEVVRIEDGLVADVGPIDLGDIRLEPEGRLIGRVVDENGHPATDVTVTKKRQSDDMSKRHLATVDVLGRFVFDRLASGNYEVWTDSTSNPTPKLVTLAPGETKRDLVIIVPGKRRIVGRVIHSTGSPVAFAWVIAVKDRPGNSADDGPAQSITLANGEFSLDATGNGPFTVFVTLAGNMTRGATGSSYARVMGVELGGAPLVITLPRSSPIGGKVVDASDHPVAGVTVTAFDPESRAQVALEVTNADGTFTLDIRPGDTVRLVVTHPQNPADTSASRPADGRRRSTEFPGIACGTQGLILRLPRDP